MKKPKEAVLSLRIPLRFKKKIERKARRYRVSQNSVIIDAIRKDLESRETTGHSELVKA
jgi:hypothetical protein